MFIFIQQWTPFQTKSARTEIIVRANGKWSKDRDALVSLFWSLFLLEFLCKVHQKNIDITGNLRRWQSSSNEWNSIHHNLYVVQPFCLNVHPPPSQTYSRLLTILLYQMNITYESIQQTGDFMGWQEHLKWGGMPDISMSIGTLEVWRRGKAFIERRYRCQQEQAGGST